LKVLCILFKIIVCVRIEIYRFNFDRKIFFYWGNSDDISPYTGWKVEFFAKVYFVVGVIRRKFRIEIQSILVVWLSSISGPFKRLNVCQIIVNLDHTCVLTFLIKLTKQYNCNLDYLANDLWPLIWFYFTLLQVPQIRIIFFTKILS